MTQIKKVGVPTVVKDDIFWVEANFRKLTDIFDKGKLDPGEHEAYAKEEADFDKVARKGLGLE
jgi:hypothetical protein